VNINEYSPHGNPGVLSATNTEAANKSAVDSGTLYPALSPTNPNLAVFISAVGVNTL